MYTNSSGYFTSTKKFKNKVKLIVKFKNNDASVRGMRGIRVWQMLLPVQKKFGPLQGSEINTFTYTFTRQVDLNSKGTQNYVAAITHNAVQQFKDYATAQGTGQPPTGLKFLISKWGKKGDGGLSGMAPLFNKRIYDGLVDEIIYTFIVADPTRVVGGLVRIADLLKEQVDVIINFNVVEVQYINSDLLSEVVYHELAHTAIYKKNGLGWYNEFVDAVTIEIVANFISNKSLVPYGSGNMARSPIIALGEGWPYHYGHSLADARYGTNTSVTTGYDGAGYPVAFYPNGTLHPHLEYLEKYFPNSNKNFPWIPRGLFQDLKDNTISEFTDLRTVDDQVSGFTDSQLFNAISSDVRSPQAYRDRLLQQNSNRQSTQVISLFNQYNYR